VNSATTNGGEWLLRRIPAFQSLRGYSREDLRGDVVGGLSVASVAVPQAMAYALIAGLPPQYGLYTAIVMTAVGALFDSSRQLINGPTNAISIALLGAIGTVADPGIRVEVAILLAFMIGAIQMAIAVARLGDLTRYVSHSVVVGFTAGASVLLILDQLKNLLGQRAVGDVHDHFLVRFWESLTAGGAVHGPTLTVGLGTIALVLALRLVKRVLRIKLLPEFLIAVIAMATATWYFGLEAQGVRVVGEIPSELPKFAVPTFEYAWIREYASSALAIALLGLLEAIAMAKAIASVTRQKLSANQQCLSEGLANATGSFFSCMPGSGSLTRSAINVQAGGRKQWAGVVSAAAVALTVVVFAPYARFIPRSALAALLMLTALRMVNLRELRYHMRASRFDAVIVAVTAISAFAISIEFCVLIGVFMSFLLAVPRAGHMRMTEFVESEGDHVRERLREDVPASKLLIFGLEGEMFFGSAVSLEHHFEKMESRITPDTRVLILRMKRAHNPDAVGLAALEDFIKRVRARGVDVLLCGVRPVMRVALERSGLLAQLQQDHVFLEQRVRQTSTQEAVRFARKLCAEENTDAVRDMATDAAT
jgi:SulP family sulfate permease